MLVFERSQLVRVEVMCAVTSANMEAAPLWSCGDVYNNAHIIFMLDGSGYVLVEM